MSGCAPGTRAPVESVSRRYTASPAVEPAAVVDSSPRVTVSLSVAMELTFRISVPIRMRSSAANKAPAPVSTSTSTAAPSATSAAVAVSTPVLTYAAAVEATKADLSWTGLDSWGVQPESHLSASTSRRYWGPATAPPSNLTAHFTDGYIASTPTAYSYVQVTSQLSTT